jgi:predicted aconitase
VATSLGSFGAAEDLKNLVMPIELTQLDQQMLAGQRGPACRLAMAILVRMAEVCQARELMDITQAHIDGCGLLSQAGLEFAETLAAQGGRVVVPTTLNMGPLDLQNWRAFGVEEDFAARATRQGKAYTDMGCIPTWSCAPYQGYLTPRFGQQIAWGESNAIVYANSVLGARTNRYGDYIDICAALTGRVPRCGLHLTANRRGQVLVHLAGFDEAMLRDELFYPVLGHLIGPLVGEEIPVIEGFPAWASGDDLKAFGAAAASAGAVALFHAVGVTPEAPTAEAAFQNRPPERTIDLGPADWRAALADLSSAGEGEPLDLVVLGCPHFSYAEFARLVECIRACGAGTCLLAAGRQVPAPQAPPCTGHPRVHPNVEFVVVTCQQSHALLQRAGWMDELAAFGARITLDTCVFHTPMVRPGTKVIMTNSGKCAYYAPGELGVRVAFGSLADCVRSAVAGRVCRRAT